MKLRKAEKIAKFMVDLKKAEEEQNRIQIAMRKNPSSLRIINRLGHSPRDIELLYGTMDFDLISEALSGIIDYLEEKKAEIKTKIAQL